jgi:hypothetical protein
MALRRRVVGGKLQSASPDSRKMREFLKVLGAFAIVLIFFYGTLFFLTDSATSSATSYCPQGETVDLKPPFQKSGNGFAYVAAVPSLESRSDSSTTPLRSKFLICEEGLALGPPHTVHAEVATKGKGRFSHWSGAGFIFSASDNSNPNINQRHYRAVLESK